MCVYCVYTVTRIGCNSFFLGHSGYPVRKGVMVKIWSILLETIPMFACSFWTEQNLEVRFMMTALLEAVTSTEFCGEKSHRLKTERLDANRGRKSTVYVSEAKSVSYCHVSGICFRI